MVRLTGSPRRVIHVTDRHLPIFHGEVREVMFEDSAVSSLELLLCCSVSCLGMCNDQFT